MTTSTDQRYFAFSGFYLDSVERRLLGADHQPIPLSSRAFDVLHYLVQHPGEDVDKGALMAAVWPNTIVEENNLNQAVAALRRALNETPDTHRFILTIPGRGYRFIPEVRALASLPGTTAPAEQAADEEIEKSSHTAGRRTQPVVLGAGALLIGLVIVVVGYMFWQRPPPEPASVEKQRQAVTPSAPPTPDKSVTVVGAPLQSVAVLPFADMSPAKDQEYFADGVAEEVLNQLSRIRDLFVVGRTSSFSFKGKNEDLRVIGEKLGVAHILEGSVRKEGDRVRVSAQLVKAADGYQLWSQSYDRTLEDIFAIQDEIAQSVSQALAVTLGVGELARVPGMTHNVAAYDAYLAGVALRSEMTLEPMRQALDPFQRALTLDPAFALSWVELTWLYEGLSQVDTSMQASEAAWLEKRDEAIAAVQRLTPDAPVVNELLAIRSMRHGEWQEAERQLEAARVAAERQGLRARTEEMYGYFLLDTGRARETVGFLERAKSFDPLAAIVAIYLAEALANAGNLPAAIAEQDRGLQLQGFQALLRPAALITALADGDRALIERRLALVGSGPDTLGPAVNAAMQPLLDRPAEALAELRRFVATTPPTWELRLAVHWAAYFGDPEFALQLLQGIPHQEPGVMLGIELWRPMLRNARALPAFKDLVRKAGFVDYWRATGNWGDFCRPVGEEDFECQ